MAQERTTSQLLKGIPELVENEQRTVLAKTGEQAPDGVYFHGARRAVYDRALLKDGNNGLVRVL